MNEKTRGVIPVRKTSVTSVSGRATGSSIRASAPNPAFRQPVAAPRGRGVSRFSGAKNVSAVFGKLDLQSDEADQENASKVPEQMLKQARKSGLLNLSGRCLITVPTSVWRLHESGQESKPKGFSTDKIEEDDTWWENVELNKLILASNQLIQISSEIQNLQGLTVLDLHDNCLESLPDEIGQLDNLSKINLNHNRISHLPEGFFQLRNLRSLTACHNGMLEISNEIGRLDLLEQLDLAHNNLKELPPGIGYLTKATRLDVSHNNLTALPPQFGALRHLTFFDGSNNNLSDVMDTMEDMGRLEQVYLHHNQIKVIPRLRNCPNLKELHLGFNRIEELTDEDVENVPGVKLLDLRDNKVKCLPDSIINLQMLERFDLSNNDLSGLPPALGTLPNLKFLSVDGNGMKTIRRDILQRGTTELMKFLRSRIDEAELLRLRETGNISPNSAGATLGVSPPVPDKFAMKAAQMMNMSKKDISSVPKEAVDNAVEARVTGADLSRNRLAEFPTVIQPLLPLLSQLDISFNRLDLVPPMIGLGQNLQYINLSNNKLTQLPDELANLPQLREICLSFNKFTQLPACIYNLSKLEILVAESNQIAEIDVDGLSKLTRLAVFDVQNNNIDHVPPSLGNLRQIKSILLEGNPFRVPRAQILAKGTESIMSYLRDRIPKDP